MNGRKQTKDLNFQLQMMDFLVGVVLLSIAEMVCKGTKLIGISADPQYMACEQQYVGGSAVLNTKPNHNFEQR